MKKYFAYGSNLSVRQMQLRCPGHQRVGVGVLRGHRWIISSHGYANVVPSPPDAVWGVVYDLTEADEQALDRYEGVADGLYRKETLPVEINGASLPCLVYVDPVQEEGKPWPEYVVRINQGLADAELPQAYVQHYIRPFVPVTAC